MMQSMSMLLSALKNDLRHSIVPDVAAKKRDAATTQLWRAFVAYQRSFAEIEQFASSSKIPGHAAKKSLDAPVHLPSQSRVNRDMTAKTGRRCERRQVREADVIKLSESESEDGVTCKRPRYDAADTVEASAPTPVSSAAVDLVASSSDSSLAPSAVTSHVSLDVTSDTSASCVCVEAASEMPEQSDGVASE